MQEITLPLSQEVEAYGEKLGSLTFRPPRGEDFMVCGYPMIMLSSASMDQDGDQPPGDIGEAEARPNATAISKLIARLANIPLGAVKKMSAADWMASMGVVLSFLGEPAPAKQSSMPASTLPGHGSSTQSVS